MAAAAAKTGRPRAERFRYGMGSAETVIAHFRSQAESCRRLGSPFTALLLDAVADSLPYRPAWAGALLDWPGDCHADALALRVAGALHRAVLENRDAALAKAYRARRIDAAAAGAALERQAALLADYLQSPPQTNDPQRSAVLLGGFQTIAARTQRPLALAEIGASAGLNQVWDAYSYMFGSWRWVLREPAPLTIRAEWQGRTPPLAPLTVQSRAACDIAPLDLQDEAQCRRLLSYIWADQDARLRRVAAAITHCRAQQIAVARMKAGAFVTQQLQNRPPDAAFVLYHSIVWQYIPGAEQRAIVRAMKQAGAKATEAAPLAWLRFEPGECADGADLTLTLWPGGETVRLAEGDYHGRWIRWLG